MIILSRWRFISRWHILWPLLSLPLTLFPVACGSYSCPDPNGHCYGTVSVRPSNLNGITTSVTAVSLNGGDGHVNDEMWLVQENNPACSNTSNQCWVEIGLRAATPNPTEVHVFWEDHRPNQGVFRHDMGALQAQEIGQPVFLLIGIRPGSPNTFDVEALTCTSESGPGTCQRRVFRGTSTNNSMVPTRWDIGLELEGTMGASAPQTRFFDNIHTDPTSPIGWASLTIDGSQSVQSPVKAG